MKRTKTPQTVTQKADEKQADILRAVLGVGLATKHYFITRIKRAGGFDTVEAEKEFERLYRAGVIREAGKSDSGVQYFEG